MTRDETIALWAKCENARATALSGGSSFEEAHEAAKTVWNKWALPLVAERKRLMNAQLLKFESQQPDILIAPRKKALNTESLNFDAISLVDFSSHAFEEIADFKGFVFPGNTRMGVDLSERSRASTAAIFKKYVSFAECIFNGELRFKGVKFFGNASFSKAEFCGDCNFAEVNFVNAVWFRNAHFQKDVWFGQTTFASYCDFIGTKFAGTAAFNGIRSFGIFDLNNSVFAYLPDFTQASFQEAPDISNINLPMPSFRGSSRFADVHKYRALRRMAVEGHDHVNEQAFLKGEIRSKRGTQDRPWHAAYWMGIFYDGFSDFARSIARPLWLWVLSAAAFAVLYLQLSDNGIAAGMCANRQPGTPIWDAVYLAYKNALLVIGWESEQKLNAVHKCLYSSETAPSYIAVIQLVQNLISAVLLFLLLLGVRNRFKIK